MLQILMANIAFYVFSFINQVIAQKRIDLALAAHHLIVPIFYIFMLITPAFPEILASSSSFNSRALSITST